MCTTSSPRRGKIPRSSAISRKRRTRYAVRRTGSQEERARGKKGKQVQCFGLRAEKAGRQRREAPSGRLRRATPGRDARDGARSAEGRTLARDGSLLPEMPGEARLCAERAARLCLRQRQARSLRGLLQRSDAGAVRLVEARTRDDRGRRVLAEPLLLLSHGAWRRSARLLGRSGARRDDGDELPRRQADE